MQYTELLDAAHFVWVQIQKGSNIFLLQLLVLWSWAWHVTGDAFLRGLYFRGPVIPGLGLFWGGVSDIDACAAIAHTSTDVWRDSYTGEANAHCLLKREQHYNEFLWGVGLVAAVAGGAAALQALSEYCRWRAEVSREVARMQALAPLIKELQSAYLCSTPFVQPSFANSSIHTLEDESKRRHSSRSSSLHKRRRPSSRHPAFSPRVESAKPHPIQFYSEDADAYAYATAPSSDSVSALKKPGVCKKATLWQNFLNTVHSVWAGKPTLDETLPLPPPPPPPPAFAENTFAFQELPPSVAATNVEKTIPSILTAPPNTFKRDAIVSPTLRGQRELRSLLGLASAVSPEAKTAQSSSPNTYGLRSSSSLSKIASPFSAAVAQPAPKKNAETQKLRIHAPLSS